MNQSICYCILCHNNPEQVKRIIETLKAEDAFFVIHVDAKSTDVFPSYEGDDNVAFVDKRVSVVWGDISMVNAELALSEYAIQRYPNVGHYCLISGADFPVKSHEYIKQYHAKSPGVDYMQGLPLFAESSGWSETVIRRLKSYVVPLNSRNNAAITPKSLSLSNVKQIGKVALLNPRKLGMALKILMTYPPKVPPYNMRFYAGEMWWTLTYSTLKTILEWNKAHLDYYSFFKDCQIPDETYFSTLVWNLSSCVSPDIKRYVAWEGSNKRSPRWLELRTDKSLVDGILGDSNKLFLRKTRDIALIDYISERLKSS